MKKIVLPALLAALFFSCNKLLDYLPGNNGTSHGFKKLYGGTGQESTASILFTNDGGYFLAANSSSRDGDITSNRGNYDAWAVKINKTGGIDWQKTYGGSEYELISSAINENEKYVLAGNTTSNDGDVEGQHGLYDAWVIKLNENGDLMWQKTLGGSEPDGFEQIIACASGGYLAVGSTFSNDGDVNGLHGEEDAWVVKLDDRGNIEWQKTYGGTAGDRFHSVVQTHDHGYIVVGITTSVDGDVTNNQGGGDAWVAKLDRMGNLEWEKAYGGSEAESFNDVIKTWDGDYLLSGSTNSSDGDITNAKGKGDGWVVRINYNGQLLWQKTLGGSGYEQLGQITWTPMGEYIIAGASDSDDGEVSGNDGGTDGWVIAIDDEGDVRWHQTFGGNDTDVLGPIASRLDGSYITGGWAASNDGDATGNHGDADVFIVSVKR